MKKVTKFWTKKDGSKIRICDMDDKHLLNAIKMLERTYSKVCDNLALSAFGYAGSTGGEIASYYAEQEADNLMKESWEQERIGEEFPIFNDLVKEAERRKLEWN